VDSDNPEPGELVAPPTEGEMTQANSAAEWPMEDTRTGGVHTESKETKNEKSEPTGIKSKLLSSESTPNQLTQPTKHSINQPVVPKSTTVCLTPVMCTNLYTIVGFATNKGLLPSVVDVTCSRWLSEGCLM
jgi:hypothetical protein